MYNKIYKEMKHKDKDTISMRLYNSFNVEKCMSLPYIGNRPREGFGK
jgi:hypothetical protein